MSGRLGFLVPVVVIVVWLVARHVVNTHLFEDGYYGSHTWSSVIGVRPCFLFVMDV